MNGRMNNAFLFVSRTRFSINSSATIVLPALVGAEYTKLPKIKHIAGIKRREKGEMSSNFFQYSTRSKAGFLNVDVMIGTWEMGCSSVAMVTSLLGECFPFMAPALQ